MKDVTAIILLLMAALIPLTSRAVPGATSAAADTAAAADTTALVDSTPLPVELDEEFFARLDDQTCTDLNGFAYREVPRFVLGDRPDLLYEFVLYWEDRCLTTEPVFRIMLLGSIWDAGFDEDLYGEEVIDRLIDRYDPPVKTKYPDLRRKFDEFSSSFADQLLPHVPNNSLQEFFCLFYSGKTAEAWDLLKSEDLQDTWLRYYYDQEMEALDRKGGIATYAATGGIWSPRGGNEFIGEKAVVGGLVGLRWTHWLARLALDFRPGRTDQPYRVDQDGFSGRSDRFNAVFLGGEFGRILYRQGRHNLDLFLGAGIETVKPFKDEDLVILGYNVSAGLGYRLLVGQSRNWSLGVDVRHEWIDNQSQGTDSMSGRAWSLRFSVGFLPDNVKIRRLRGLGVDGR